LPPEKERIPVRQKKDAGRATCETREGKKRVMKEEVDGIL
jgi:hypothetical protein